MSAAAPRRAIGPDRAFLTVCRFRLRRAFARRVAGLPTLRGEFLLARCGVPSVDHRSKAASLLHVIGGSGKSPVCASRNLWLSCSRRGLGQATKSPIGADAVHKPVVNSEEVFWISFRPKVAELGS